MLLYSSERGEMEIRCTRAQIAAAYHDEVYLLCSHVVEGVPKLDDVGVVQRLENPYLRGQVVLRSLREKSLIYPLHRHLHANSTRAAKKGNINNRQKVGWGGSSVPVDLNACICRDILFHRSLGPEHFPLQRDTRQFPSPL